MRISVLLIIGAAALAVGFVANARASPSYGHLGKAQGSDRGSAKEPAIPPFYYEPQEIVRPQEPFQILVGDQDGNYRHASLLTCMGIPHEKIRLVEWGSNPQIAIGAKRGPRKQPPIRTFEDEGLEHMCFFHQTPPLWTNDTLQALQRSPSAHASPDFRSAVNARQVRMRYDPHTGQYTVVSNRSPHTRDPLIPDAEGTHNFDDSEASRALDAGVGVAAGGGTTPPLDTLSTPIFDPTYEPPKLLIGIISGGSNESLSKAKYRPLVNANAGLERENSRKAQCDVLGKENIVFFTNEPLPEGARRATLDPKYEEGGRDGLPYKVLGMWRYIYEHYLDEYEWFMKADDDTMIHRERLLRTLSTYRTDIPVVLGRRVGQQLIAFCHGGAGMILNRAALRVLGPALHQCHTSSAYNWEDQWVHNCLSQAITIGGDTPISCTTLQGLGYDSLFLNSKDQQKNRQLVTAVYAEKPSAIATAHTYHSAYSDLIYDIAEWQKEVDAQPEHVLRGDFELARLQYAQIRDHSQRPMCDMTIGVPANSPVLWDNDANIPLEHDGNAHLTAEGLTSTSTSSIRFHAECCTQVSRSNTFSGNRFLFFAANLLDAYMAPLVEAGFSQLHLYGLQPLTYKDQRTDGTQERDHDVSPITDKGVYVDQGLGLEEYQNIRDTLQDLFPNGYGGKESDDAVRARRTSRTQFYDLSKDAVINPVVFKGSRIDRHTPRAPTLPSSALDKDTVRFAKAKILSAFSTGQSVGRNAQAASREQGRNMNQEHTGQDDTLHAKQRFGMIVPIPGYSPESEFIEATQLLLSLDAVTDMRYVDVTFIVDTSATVTCSHSQSAKVDKPIAADWPELTESDRATVLINLFSTFRLLGVRVIFGTINNSLYAADLANVQPQLRFYHGFVSATLKQLYDRLLTKDMQLYKNIMQVTHHARFQSNPFRVSSPTSNVFLYESRPQIYPKWDEDLKKQCKQCKFDQFGKKFRGSFDKRPLEHFVEHSNEKFYTCQNTATFYTTIAHNIISSTSVMEHEMMLDITILLAHERGTDASKPTPPALYLFTYFARRPNYSPQGINFSILSYYYGSVVGIDQVTSWVSGFSSLLSGKKMHYVASASSFSPFAESSAPLNLGNYLILTNGRGDVAPVLVLGADAEVTTKDKLSSLQESFSAAATQEGVVLAHRFSSEDVENYASDPRPFIPFLAKFYFLAHNFHVRPPFYYADFLRQRRQCAVFGGPSAMNLQQTAGVCSVDFITAYTSILSPIIEYSEAEGDPQETPRFALLHSPNSYNGYILRNIAMRWLGKTRKRVFINPTSILQEHMFVVDRFQFQIYKQRWPHDHRHNNDVWAVPIAYGWTSVDYPKVREAQTWVLGKHHKVVMPSTEPVTEFLTRAFAAKPSGSPNIRVGLYLRYWKHGLTGSVVFGIETAEEAAAVAKAYWQTVDVVLLTERWFESLILMRRVLRMDMASLVHIFADKLDFHRQEFGSNPTSRTVPLALTQITPALLAEVMKRLEADLVFYEESVVRWQEVYDSLIDTPEKKEQFESEVKLLQSTVEQLSELCNVKCNSGVAQCNMLRIENFGYFNKCGLIKELPLLSNDCIKYQAPTTDPTYVQEEEPIYEYSAKERLKLERKDHLHFLQVADVI